MEFSDIQEYIWKTSVSYGSCPYTFNGFAVGEDREVKLPQNFFGPFKRGIAFYIYDRYAESDFVEYLSYSREFAGIGDDAQKSMLIGRRVAEVFGKNAIRHWQECQAALGVGAAISILNLQGQSSMVLPPAASGPFAGMYPIEGCTLCDILLY